MTALYRRTGSAVRSPHEEGGVDHAVYETFAGATISIVLVTACGGGSTPTTTTVVTTTTVQVEEAPAPTSTTTTLLDIERTDLTAGLPRVGRYGFLEVSLTGATLGFVEPRTYLGESPQPSDQIYLFLTLEVANLSEKGDTANWPPSPYGVVVDGEALGAPDMLEGRPHVGLPALDSADVVMAFEVPEDTAFEDVTFVVAEPDSIPLEIPLTGDLSDDPSPVAISIEGEGPVQGGAHGCNQALTVELLGGNTSIDLLETESYPSSYGQRRALLGDRFLTIDTLITNHGGSRCGGGSTNIDGNVVRLYVDDRPTAPITHVAMGLGPNVAEEVTWHFVFPEDAADLELVFGTEDGTTLAVPVDTSSSDD